MKKQISMRLSALTETQLTELTSKLGMNRTELITLAVNNFYQKMIEEKMKANSNLINNQDRKTLSQTHERIIDWVGDGDGFVQGLDDFQARDMLAWLQDNDFSIERDGDMEKLAEYCQGIS